MSESLEHIRWGWWMAEVHAHVMEGAEFHFIEFVYKDAVLVLQSHDVLSSRGCQLLQLDVLLSKVSELPILQQDRSLEQLIFFLAVA